MRVPELWVKVPPEWVKLVETLNVPDEEGAVKVPDDISTAPLTSTVPLDPVNVPPDTVSEVAVTVPDDAVKVPLLRCTVMLECRTSTCSPRPTLMIIKE